MTAGTDVDAGGSTERIPHEQDLLVDAVRLGRDAKILLALAGEGLEIGLTAARMARGSMANASDVRSLTEAAGLLFLRWRQVRSSLAELSERACDLLVVATRSAELGSFAGAVYELNRHRLLVTMRRLAESIIDQLEATRLTLLEMGLDQENEPCWNDLKLWSRATEGFVAHHI